jgi:hypothetical protein
MALQTDDIVPRGDGTLRVAIQRSKADPSEWGASRSPRAGRRFMWPNGSSGAAPTSRRCSAASIRKSRSTGRWRQPSSGAFGVPQVNWTNNWNKIIPLSGGPEDARKAREGRKNQVRLFNPPKSTSINTPSCRSYRGTTAGAGQSLIR